MSSANITIELAVLLVCIYSGYGVGKPAKNTGTEEMLRQHRKPYIWLWFAMVVSGIFIAVNIADFTMIVIAVGLFLGFTAGRKATPS